MKKPIKKIALVFPPSSLNSVGVENSFIPNGILTLAKQIHDWRPDIEIKVFDGSVYPIDHIIHKVDVFSPDLLGVSALCGNYEAGKYLLEKCHRQNTISFVGNHHANYLHSILPLITEKDLFPEIDYIITGNHDISVLRPLIEKLEAGKTDFNKIPNLCFRKNANWYYPEKITYKNTLASPDLSYIEDINLYHCNYRRVFKNFHQTISEIKALNINFYKACKQCDEPCIYCCLKDYKILKTEPKQYWNEIQILYDKGFNLFFETANSFTSLGNNFLEKLAETMPHSLKEKIEFMVYARADEITEKAIFTLKKLNVIRVIFGLDAADETILKEGLKKKNVYEGMNYKVAKLLNDNNIQLFGCYVPGAEGETPETLKKTKEEIQTIMDLKNCCTIEYTSLAPMPGSLAWNKIKTSYFAENGVSDVLHVKKIAKYWVEKMLKNIDWETVEEIKDDLRKQAESKNIIFGGYY